MDTKKDTARSLILCSGGPFHGSMLNVSFSCKSTGVFEVGLTRGQYVFEGSKLVWKEKK